MQQKVFRIEQMLTKPRAPYPPAPVATPRAEPAQADLLKLERELDLIYQAIDRSKKELATLHGNADDGPPLPRAANELGAAIDGMEKATQQILKAAEVADEDARTLTAALKNDYERSLAQDIQDHVVKIYEACNFQDLAGQRIRKAMDTLNFIEQSIERVIDIWGGLDKIRRHDAKPSTSRKLVNGPKLDGDVGHASQNDIDRMFA